MLVRENVEFGKFENALSSGENKRNKQQKIRFFSRYSFLNRLYMVSCIWCGVCATHNKIGFK